MKFLSIILFIGFLFVTSNCQKPKEAQADKAAITAAENWLALVDAGQYAKSWQDAASLFKGAVDQQTWEKTVESVRKPLGKVISREVESAEYRTSLPGAPDGEYVVIRFKTEFENKKKAYETVTPMKDKDGEWRVSGYYIN